MSRLFFLLTAFSSLVACTTGTDMAFEDEEQAMPVPGIVRVIFDEDGNPFTMPSDIPLTKFDDSEICKDFTLTEEDIREFFRDARRSNRMEAHEFIVSRCRVSGDLILGDGRKAPFEIDQNRQGWMAPEKGTFLWFYCATCKNQGYFEACDIDCLRADE
jgi:hypothetical protein